MNTLEMAPRVPRKIPYSGGWRKAYAELGKALGYEVSYEYGRIQVRKDGKRLGTLDITKELDLEKDIPRLEQAKRREELEESVKRKKAEAAWAALTPEEQEAKRQRARQRRANQTLMMATLAAGIVGGGGVLYDRPPRFGA